jgi:hypothetical protein
MLETLGLRDRVSFLNSCIGAISQSAHYFPLRRVTLRLSDLHSVINCYPIIPTNSASVCS